MSLTFALERFDANWQEFMALAALHWDGTKSYRRHEPLAPSLARYQAANDTGFLRFATARQDGQLVGYLTFYVTASMHSQVPMAVEDTFFLHPDVRKGRNALRLLQFVEAQCRAWGVAELLCSCETDNTSGIRRLLEFLDYEPVIMQYRKRLLSPCADSAQPLPHEVSDVRADASRCS